MAPISRSPTMQRVRTFMLAVMLTALCTFPALALSLPRSLAPDPQPSAAPAAAPPVNVRVGIYVVQLGDPDLKDSSFKAVFWLWFRWKGSPDLDPMKKF